nr:hypothetical protein Iba_chr07aCG1960 [Ipomoea batatas]
MNWQWHHLSNLYENEILPIKEKDTVKKDTGRDLPGFQKRRLRRDGAGEETRRRGEASARLGRRDGGGDVHDGRRLICSFLDDAGADATTVGEIWCDGLVLAQLRRDDGVVPAAAVGDAAEERKRDTAGEAAGPGVLPGLSHGGRALGRRHGLPFPVVEEDCHAVGG